MRCAILLPNFLTLVRLLAGPLYICFGDLPPTRMQLAGLAIAAATDVLDGRLARYLGASSGFGAAFDTVADKVLVLALVLKASTAGVIPEWFVWLVLVQYAVIGFEGAIYTLKFTEVPAPPVAARVAAVFGIAFAFVAVTCSLNRGLVTTLAVGLLLANLAHMAAALIRVRRSSADTASLVRRSSVE
jgi:phosphatidylglycerophosphate synthase